MSWRSKRQSIYLGGVILFLLLVVGLPTYLVVREQPSCFDGVENGDERGIDCGGACLKICLTDIVNPTILWSRSFKVTDSVYNAVAYVENTNLDAGTSNIGYRFTLFDEENLLIAERRGSTFLAPNKVVPIFEGGIPVGNRIPKRTFFEFIEPVDWERTVNASPNLLIRDERLENTDTTPRLSATIHNESTESLRSIEVVAVLFDREANAVATSKTFVENLPKKDSANIVFTWPEAFEQEVVRIEITPRVEL